MVQTIDCPRCNGGKLKIELTKGYNIQTSGALSQLPCIVYCKTCNRKIKYAIVKEKEVVED
jgi:hypothetical protein